MTMLESGNWIVPYVGGEPYFRKPPLVNWMIAASIKLCGVRNEWSARLPTVLCVLVLGLTITWVCTPWLGARSALAAGLFAIANVSMIEKGRLAEIEGIYVALSGIAIVLWMVWALRTSGQGDRAPVSSWLLWTVPFIFLGLAALAKGPTHLLYFYAVVLATKRGRREFFSLPHLVGVLLMTGIFAAWAVPYFQATAELSREGAAKSSAAGVWQEQMAERFGGGGFVWRDWLLSVPRGLSNFLPWLLLVPVWWTRPPHETWFRPLRNVVTATYIVLLLIPGFLPRYAMPLLIPASVLLAAALREPLWLPVHERSGRLISKASQTQSHVALDGWVVARAGSALAALGIIVFALFIVPRVNRADDIRPLGRAISDAVPTGETLYVFDPSYQPALFYIRPPLVYENEVDRLPAHVSWLLCREKAVDKFRKHWSHVEVLREFKDKQGNKLRLVSLSERH